MKIKVKLTGKYFPDEYKGKEVEVHISQVVLPSGTSFAVDCEPFSALGYEIEPIEGETGKRPANSIEFGDNKLKSMSVEFK